MNPPAHSTKLYYPHLVSFIYSTKFRSCPRALAFNVLLYHFTLISGSGLRLPTQKNLPVPTGSVFRWKSSHTPLLRPLAIPNTAQGHGGNEVTWTFTRRPRPSLSWHIPLLSAKNALPSSASPSATLTITGTLAVGDERCAQLVVCSVAPNTSQPPFEAVAKIFDALYYAFESRDAAHVPSNTTKQADVDYNIAVVFELSRRGKAPCQLAKLPENPMQFFWDMSFAEFAGWTPSEWENNLRHSQRWLKERFGGKEASNYAPVGVKLEFAEY
ncbi:hypothetical protein VTI74DRAFT_6450 [Chaetomium olivicolor]